MRKYYFYCPNCGMKDYADVLPKSTVGNIRDGFGMPIHHYECPQCHNLDAGYMQFRNDKFGEFPQAAQEGYYESVIARYQNIRGIGEV